MAALVFLVVLAAALAAAHRPLGDYMAGVYTGTGHRKTETVLYRIIGVRPETEQTWTTYARSVLAFSGVSVVFLYGFQRLLNLGAPRVAPGLAWNTSVSFVTNTNWQAYPGETAMGHLVQMAGLAVQNFVSAAVGLSVAIALVRGLSRERTEHLGNFWTDLVRGVVRILLPACAVIAIVLIIGGTVQNFDHFETYKTLIGRNQSLPGGPVASQEAIKELGTNGGGFFNANSAHPYENPAVWTNWLQVFLLLVIPFSLPRTFGRMVGDPRQGRAITAAMAVIATVSAVGLDWVQTLHHGTVPSAAGAALEGVETRFGVAQSATFAAATTLTSTGAVNSFHDSYTSLGGMITMLNMMLGEVAPGGVGSGLYGILILSIITVFVAGLMVGRTPEYLGKKIGGREIKFASMYFLITPVLVLTGTAVAMAFAGPRSSMLNTGPHGFSEVLYAFTSAGANNGSAFAGLNADTGFYNTALGLVMVCGRFLPMIFVLGLAGSLARQPAVPAGAGTLPTHRPQFVGLVVGVTVVLVALTFLPALALGPLAEGLH
ncbi:potassium-transporting ATPase subunit KdpA [Actinocorallia longicatena]|uniref:Potassium-transporting ATPase potassium-binding subunit n=1 Tax=Actinocorallia longicatena TaxID=111803 RepID=A0ABP6QBP7_9ACTN